MNLKRGILFFFLVCSVKLFSQEPTDAGNAIVVCGNINMELNSNGTGLDDFQNSGNIAPSCGFTESQSLWVRVVIDQGGTLGFTITSNNGFDDYDFAVYGPNVTPTTLGSSIRCSSTNPQSAGTPAITGMNATETDTSEGPGPAGNGFVRWLDVLPGEEYYILIDNFNQQDGATLEWTGTATFPGSPNFNIPTGTSIDIENCDTDGTIDDQTVFDLTTNEALILGNQANINITYHTTINDAQIGINEIANPQAYRNLTNPEVIYIRLTNSDTGCFEVTDFTLTVSGFNVNTPSGLGVCDDDTDGFTLFNLTDRANEILNGLSPSDYTLQYYTDDTYTNQIADPTAFENTILGGQPIYVRVIRDSDGCYADASFSIEVYALPEINTPFLFQQCDEDGVSDGITDFNLSEADEYLTQGNNNLTVQYFLSFLDADTNSNPVTPFPFSNSTANTVYARVETPEGCHRVAQVDLSVSTTSFPADYTYTLENCDDDDVIDGFAMFDLNQATTDMLAQFPANQNLTVSYYRNLSDAQLEINELSSDYTNETPFNQTVYVRVESQDNGQCVGLGPHLTLVVNPRPEFDLNSTDIICLNNNTPLTISISNPNDVYTYQWTNEAGINVGNVPSINIQEPGVYTVVATSDEGCLSFPNQIAVEASNIATITQEDIQITDDSENNTITIETANQNLGIGDYEYALNDQNSYQSEPYFEGVPAGIHTVYVRDRNNCGEVSIEVAILGFPKFFTPNNDGVNDTWQLAGVTHDSYREGQIHIFDRYGKVVAQIDALNSASGWDGLHQGKPLPSTDYWFTVQLVDINGNVRQRKGHFSLIRK